MLLTALIFFLILSILVLIHEFGHYAVARIIGVHVEEFGLGLPPRIFGRTIGKTLYSLNWLPIGGFVKLAGEDEIDSPKSKVLSPKSKVLSFVLATIQSFFNICSIRVRDRSENPFFCVGICAGRKKIVAESPTRRDTPK